MTLLIVAVLGVVIGGGFAFVTLRRRRPRSLEDNLRNFRRGLDALDPENDPLRKTRNGRNGRGRN